MKTVRPARFLLSIALALLVGVVQLTGSSAEAATAKSSSPPKTVANSMKVSPLRTDITVKPGTTGTVTVYITNMSKDTVSLKPIENDFVAGDEKGTPAIILDENSHAPTHSLKRFMEPLQNITLSPHATKAIKLHLKVPITAQAGGYFGALRFAPAVNGNQPVSLNSSVASLVLMTVPGATVEKLALTDFTVQQNGNSSSNFRTPKDLKLSVRFKNEGNLQEAPFGQISVLKGKKVVYSSDFNQQNPKQMVLPDSARRWDVPLKNIGKFGKYTVKGTFGYGNGQSVDVSKTIWIVPTVVILIAAGVLVALIIIILLIRALVKARRHRSTYRRR